MSNEDELKKALHDFEKNAIEEFISKYRGAAQDAHETITPLLVSRNDIAKTLITLSSAILALTITAYSGFFAKHLHNLTNTHLLITWLMLLLTIFLCLSSLWLNMLIVQTIIEFKESVFEVIEDIKSVVGKDKTELQKKLDKHHDLPFSKINKNIDRAYYLLQASFFSFFASLIIFLIIGWSSLSSSQAVTSTLNDSIQSNATNSFQSSSVGNTGCCPCNKHSMQKRR